MEVGSQYDWSLPVTTAGGRPVSFRRPAGKYRVERVVEAWAELDPDRFWWESPDQEAPPTIRVWRVLDQHGGLWELGERQVEKQWTVLRRWD